MKESKQKKGDNVEAIKCVVVFFFFNVSSPLQRTIYADLNSMVMSAKY